ncbi:MAG: redoxin domain-containing protein [Planctomycetota bacterium]
MKDPGGRRGLIRPGEKAPPFSLQTTPDQRIALEDFHGQPVVLVFYPADWSPVCSDELAIFNEVLPEIQKHGAVLLGVSVDGVWCHNAFAAARKFHFSLLADFEPKGAVARKYGVYREGDGVSGRALFVIDPRGAVAWSYESPIGVNPGADGILRALEGLQGEKKERAA